MTTRDTFDNIDDFHGYSESAGSLKDQSGTLLPSAYQKFSQRMSRLRPKATTAVTRTRESALDINSAGTVPKCMIRFMNTLPSSAPMRSPVTVVRTSRICRKMKATKDRLENSRVAKGMPDFYFN